MIVLPLFQSLDLPFTRRDKAVDDSGLGHRMCCQFKGSAAAMIRQMFLQDRRGCRARPSGVPLRARARG
jgi:hypothetical protein